MFSVVLRIEGGVARIRVVNSVVKFTRGVLERLAAVASAVDAEKRSHATQQEQNDEEQERCADTPELPSFSSTFSTPTSRSRTAVEETGRDLTLKGIRNAAGSFVLARTRRTF